MACAVLEIPVFLSLPTQEFLERLRWFFTSLGDASKPRISNSTAGSLRPSTGASMANSDNLIAFTASIVAAYLSKNSIAAAEVSSIIRTVHAAVSALQESEATVAKPTTTLVPAVPIRLSVTKDYIICLEDGRKFKSMKRHLRAAYSMSPDDYRVKWGLPHDYPVVSPGYAKRRSELAKSRGLGLGGNPSHHLEQAA
jgi:predicted transcriptional regulator